MVFSLVIQLHFIRKNHVLIEFVAFFGKPSIFLSEFSLISKINQIPILPSEFRTLHGTFSVEVDGSVWIRWVHERQMSGDAAWANSESFRTQVIDRVLRCSQRNVRCVERLFS